MSFKKLQLPNFIIAELYEDVLVELDIPKITAKKQKIISEKKWFLGENKKQIIIVVKDAEAVYLRDEWLQFLSAILSACKLNLGDVAILNYSKTNFSFAYLTDKLFPKFLLLFDVTPHEIQLPFTIAHYQIKQYNNCNFLAASSFQNMQGNTQEAKLEKSKLWLSLKKIFAI